MEGWIKLHRELRESPIFQNEKLLKIFVWCLLKANPSPERWKGIEIKAGQLVTSLSRLEAETGLSQKTIRNALKKLEKMGELVTQKGRAYTIITICNYASYQGCTTEEGTQGAHKGHAKGTRRATNKNEKNEKNIENTSSSSLQRKKDENDYFAVGDIMKFKLSGFEDEYFITAN